MSPLLQAYDALMPSPTCEELGLKEHNYFGASECSSVDSSTIGATLSSPEDSKDCLNLKATELRLRLPRSQSPERDRDSNLCLSRSSKLNVNEKPLFPCSPVKDGRSSTSQRAAVSGTKRGFSDTVQDFVQKPPSEANWTFESSGSGRDADTQKPGAEAKLPMNGSVNLMPSSSRRNSGSESFGAKDQPVGSQAFTKVLQELPPFDSNNSASATKAQVVGWPPIRSYRKNTLATPSRNTNPLFVKVSMDGAPYLRKVNLRTYTTFKELSLGLEKMFSSFTLGRCESHGASGGQNMSGTKLKDLLHGSDYMLTYEDKDRDWMLVGDVPWEMFTESCKRLKIMKSSDATGLGPRAMEKSKTT